MPNIFGKKKSTEAQEKSVEDRLDEILEEIAKLPEERQEAIWKKYDDSEDDSKGKPDTEEQIEKAEEDIAEKGADSQTEKDRIDESVGEQEKQEGDEDSQDAKDRVDESLGEEKYVKKEEYEALLDRIAKLEERANGDDELPKPKEIDDEDVDLGNTDFFKEK